jgi:hypothetical protein
VSVEFCRKSSPKSPQDVLASKQNAAAVFFSGYPLASAEITVGSLSRVKGAWSEVSTTVSMGKRRVLEITVWPFLAWAAFRLIHLPAKRGSVNTDVIIDLKMPVPEGCKKC